MKIRDILREFAPDSTGDDGGDDGFEEELKRLAAAWYNGDEDPRVEQTLMAAGWEIGQDEGYDDEPGVFVVQAGDVDGRSYLSWPAHELRQGVAEEGYGTHPSQRVDPRTGKKYVPPKSPLGKGVAEDPVTEVSRDDSERAKAVRVIGGLIDRLRQDQYQNVTADDIRQMQQLVAITGRARGIFSPATWDDLGKAGSLLDMLVNRYRESQIRSGQMPEFQGRAATAKDMARQIAQQTRGRYDYNLPRTWTTGRGQRYRDPQDYVVYPDQESYDDAWQWVESQGQKVYYRDSFDSLNTAIKIGRYMVEPASVTRGAFSSNPETEHKLSVRGAAAINQSVRTQVDITDQQAAALKDIAATRNANAMELLRAMGAVLQGQQDVKRVLDNSKKIDPRDKAKLDAIIAAATKQGQ